MILNDAPYGSERTYNGLRLAGSFAKQGCRAHGPDGQSGLGPNFLNGADRVSAAKTVLILGSRWS
jgi:hypothetical protein